MDVKSSDNETLKNLEKLLDSISHVDETLRSEDFESAQKVFQEAMRLGSFENRYLPRHLAIACQQLGYDEMAREFWSRLQESSD